MVDIPVTDDEMEAILKLMLDNNEDITARAVIRRHTQLKAASSITRSKDRAALLAHYQEKQAELRNWQKRVTKKSKDTMAKDLAERDMRIAELERQVEILTASHVAMIRAVGELGGFTQWATFFQDYQSIRNTIGELNAKQTKT
jgi:hypothetical protein